MNRPRIDKKHPWISDAGIKLLRKVKRKILAEPNTYRQDMWHCGTACCIAVHVVLQGAPNVELREVIGAKLWPFVNGDWLDWRELANEALGAIDGDTVSLFTSEPVNYWPEPYCGQWKQATTRKARAGVAARRIEHFIKTGV